MDEIIKNPIAKTDRIDTAVKALQFLAKEGLTLEVRKDVVLGCASGLIVYNLREPRETRFHAFDAISPGMIEEADGKLLEVVLCRILELYRHKHPKATEAQP